MRLADALACLLLAAAWAAAATLTAAYDSFFLLTFFLTAFFLYLSAALTQKKGSGLLTAFAAGLLLINGASVAGPGAYKLLLFMGAGAVFELLCLLKGRISPATGSFVAAAFLPSMLWTLSGTSNLSALADLTAAACLAGGLGTLAGLLLWENVAHTKAIIRFQVAGTAPAKIRGHIRKRNAANAFYKRRQ